eukprot:755462-Hanusia_phi.AAC.2
MAKFGEGDPRWKVRELGEGGRNVNGWHWTENDCFPFFKEEFQKSFEGNYVLQNFRDAFPGLTGDLHCWKLDKCSGEACVNRRKGNKVVLIYEIELAVKWESTLKNAAGEVVSTSKGTYVMPCIDTVEDLDKFEIQVKFNKDGAEYKAANDFAKTHGEKKVREIIVAAIEQLKEQAGQTGTDKVTSSHNREPEKSKSNGTTEAKPEAPKQQISSSDHKGSSIELSTDFNAPAREVRVASCWETDLIRLQIFECFTIPPKVMAFTQSKAQVEHDLNVLSCCEVWMQVGTTVGEEVLLFDGAIVGKVLESNLCGNGDKAPGQLECDRNAVLSSQNLGKALVGCGSNRLGSHTLMHMATMYSDKASIFVCSRAVQDMPRVVEEGWKRNFFDRIKMVFGFGAPEFS